MKQIKGKEIKCILWDLDDTIWEGTLLESESVTLKPGIIEIIKELDSRGILHSIVSKNNFNDAIKKLKEFKIDQYFLYPEINWNAKSSSVANIQKNLNIGFDSMLFIDDQNYERDEVKNSFPEITCMCASEYNKLCALDRLNPRFITVDSKSRREMYLTDSVRRKEEDNFTGPKESFLSNLNMKFIISKAKEEDLKRAEELTIRTNQLNATGKTYNYEELEKYSKSDSHLLLVCELIDKYGSYGKIGLSLIEMQEEYWHIRLLLMSCRVMTRGVGTVLMSYIMKRVKECGKKLMADFKHTGKNRQMYLTYKFSNFKEKHTDEEGIVIFENNLAEIHQIPKYIEVQEL